MTCLRRSIMKIEGKHIQYITQCLEQLEVQNNYWYMLYRMSNQSSSFECYLFTICKAHASLILERHDMT